MRLGLGAGLDDAGMRADRGWRPDALGVKLLAFWDAGNAASLSLSGAAVASWTDSHNGYVLSQATSGGRPVIANSINGRPAIAGDGVDDRLAIEPVPAALLAAPLEIWLLVNQPAPTSETVARGLFYVGAAGSSQRIAISRTVSGGVNRLVATVGNGGGFGSMTSTADFSGIGVVRLEVGASLSRLSFNDGGAVTASAVPSLLNTRVAVLAQNTTAPGSSFSIHQVNAILITQPLDAMEKDRLMAFMKARGGLA
jgi:hypothetical protein